MIWRNLARNTGRLLALRHPTTMDDYRAWDASRVRSERAAGFTPGPAPMPVHMDQQARWWARWLPWV